MPAKLLLIVDDHEQFGAFVRQLLDGTEFQVVGVAANGEDALRTMLTLNPEVVLLDVQLPGIDGFEVAERLAASASSPRVVMTSTRDPSDFGARLTEAPVVGFLPKQDLSVDALTTLLESRDSR